MHSIRTTQIPVDTAIEINTSNTNKQHKNTTSTRLRAGLLHLNSFFTTTEAHHSQPSFTTAATLADKQHKTTSSNPDSRSSSPPKSSPDTNASIEDPSVSIDEQSPQASSPTNKHLSATMGATRENRADSGVSCNGQQPAPAPKGSKPQPKPVVHQNGGKMPQETPSTKMINGEKYR